MAAPPARVAAYTVSITNIGYPSGGVSFTTLEGENGVSLTAAINPENLHAAHAAGIRWVVDDDPAENGSSGTPAAPANGAATTLMITAPAAPAGRGFALNFRIRAFSEIDGGVAVDTRTIKQDEIDQIRQEYIDMNKARKPARADFSNSGQSSGGHFTFAELNTGDYSYAIVTAALYGGLEGVRSGIGNRPVIVTSAYRNPRRNANVGGKPESRHLYGDAADMRISDLDGDGDADRDDWNTMSAAAQAAGATFIEPFADDPTHLHADWR